jgi:hypothetical protein
MPQPKVDIAQAEQPLADATVAALAGHAANSSASKTTSRTKNCAKGFKTAVAILLADRRLLSVGLMGHFLVAKYAAPMTNKNAIA